MSFDGGGASLGSARGEIIIGVEKAQSSLRQLQGSLVELGNAGGDSFNKLVGGLALLGASKAIGSIFTGAASSAIDFEAQLSAIQAVSGATTAQMDLLKESALAVGKDTVFSASEAANGLEELLKNGFDAAQAMDAIAGSAALAAASGEDLGTAASQISITIKQFSLSAKDAARVADLFAAAASASAADATDVAEAMKFVGATASAMGISIEDASTALAILADNGLKGSIAGTSLNQMLTSLINPSQKAADTITELGISITDAAGNIKSLPDILADVERATRNLTEAERLRALNQIFGEQGGRAILNLLKSQSKEAEATGQSWDDYNEKVTKAGAAGDQAAARLDNTRGSIEQLRGSIDTASIVIGGALTPALRQVIDAMTGVVNGFLKLDGPLQAVIGGFAGSVGIIAGFAGAMTVLGPVTTAFVANLGLIKSALTTLATTLGPVGLALAAIAAGVAIFELTKRESDQEIQTKKLTEATDAYTAALGSNTTALVNAGAFDLATGTKEFIDIWVKNGVIAQDRIDKVTAAIALLNDTSTELGGLIQQDFQDGGLFHDTDGFIDQILKQNGAYEDQIVTIEELTVALAELNTGFHISADDAKKVTDALSALTAVEIDPQFLGADIAKKADQIVQDIVAGRKSIDEGIAELTALATGGLGLDTFGLDQYNVALIEADKATKASTNVVKGWGTAHFRAALATAKTTAAFQEYVRAVTGGAKHQQDSVDILQAQADAAAKLKEQIDSVKQTFATLDLGDFDLNALAQASGNTTLQISLDTTQAVTQLDNIFRVAVGNLNNIGSLVSGVQDWADKLVNVEGTTGQIDDLLAKGLITQARYDMAQRAYNRLAADNADIQDTILAIQAKQVPVVAKGVDLLDDQLNKIKDMDGIAQTAALGFLDAGESAKFLALQTQLAAAAAGDLGENGEASMQAIVEGAVAADPYLAAMLQQMGLITIGADGTITINFDEVSKAQDAMDLLVSEVDKLVHLLADIFNIDIDDSDVTTSTNNVDFLNKALGDLPDKHTVNVDVNLDDGPTGGISTGIANLLDKGNLLGDWGSIDLPNQDLPVDETDLDNAKTTLDEWGTLDLPPQKLPVQVEPAAPKDNQKTPDFTAPPLTGTPKSFLETGTTLGESLGDGIVTGLTNKKALVTQTLADLVKPPPQETNNQKSVDFTPDKPTAITFPAPNLTALVRGFAQAINETQDAIRRIVSVVNSLTPQFGNALQDAMRAFVSALDNGFSTAVNNTQTATSRMIGIAEALIGALGNAGANAGRSFSNNISAAFFGAVTAAGNAASSLVSVVSGRLSGLGGLGYGIGQQLGFGMANGIASTISAVVSAAVNLVYSALAAARFAALIGSPSKLFAREVGEPIAQGMAVGIDDGHGAVKRSIAGLIAAAIPTVSATSLASSPTSHTATLLAQPTVAAVSLGARSNVVNQNTFTLKTEFHGITDTDEIETRVHTSFFRAIDLAASAGLFGS